MGHFQTIISTRDPSLALVGFEQFCECMGVVVRDGATGVESTCGASLVGDERGQEIFMVKLPTATSCSDLRTWRQSNSEEFTRPSVHQPV